MSSSLSQLAYYFRHGSVAVLCLGLMLGCSGKGGPTAPGLDGAGLGPNAGDGAGVAGETEQGRYPLRMSGPEDLPAYVEGEVLVVLNQALSRQDIHSVLNAWPIRLKKAISCRWGTVHRLEITDGTSVEEMVNRLRADPLVRIAEPNHIYHFFEYPHWPNDPLWESDDPGTDPRDNVFDQWGPARVGASIVWNETKGSEDVVVAVIDTGVRFDQEDLNPIIWINEDEIPDNEVDDDGNGWVDDWWGWDCADDDNDPWDEGWFSYHGTACSGVVAAAQDNGVGCTGVAPGVKVMALRIEFGDDIYESAVIESLEYARINGAAICSMSFGGGYPSEIVETQCDDVWDDGNGLILMAAAGNSDSDQYMYPAAYESVMAVGATIPFSYLGDQVDEQRIKAGDELGYYWGSNYGDWLHVMGFGEKYITTSGSSVDAYYDGVNDDFFGGTSCATPMSAAVMALIRSCFPDETPRWCWNRLIETADDLDALGFDIQTGYGRCNALRAVYGSDRFTDQEDAFGFVTLSLPDEQVFDTIHDVLGNPYHDIEDLYRFTTVADGYLVMELDIFTWGENLDLAVYTDQDMTELIEHSIGPNHAGSSTESILLNASAGVEYFLRVYSPGLGNSTVYGLRVFNTANELSITGESLAPEFIHHQGEDVPFLKLTLEIGYQATLGELIVSKHGTLPNPNWAMARLYRDTNSNGVFDEDDLQILERFPQARNRVRLGDLGIRWTYREPLVLFFAADISETPDDATVSFGLETYKDVTTVAGIEAPYTDFPIISDALFVGTDSDPPEWVTTVGIQSAEPSYLSARLGWNEAFDLLSPPMKYNVYHTDELPFDIDNATKVPDVPVEDGTDTDCVTVISNLPGETERHFVVRAEDQAGNEDDNLVILSCTPSPGGDPTNPVLLATFPLYYPYDIALKDDVLLVADGWGGLAVFDRTDPINLDQIAVWDDDYSVYSVEYDGSYAYCGGYDYFSVVDLTNPSNPQTADRSSFWDGISVDLEGDWVYVGNYYDEMLPVDVSDPYNIVARSPVDLPSGGLPFELDINGDNIYLADYYVGLLVYDRTNPAVPIRVNTFGDQDLMGILVAGDTLFATGESTGALAAYDIGSDPVSPPLLDKTTAGPGWSAYRVVVIGDHAYVSRYDYGLVVFDVSDPTDIEYVGDLPLYGAMALATDGALIYAVAVDQDYYGWLHVVI